MEYAVRFGSGWTRDGIGLMGKGKIFISGDSINLSGRQHTSIIFKALLWVLSAMMVANVLIILCSKLFSSSAEGVYDIRVIVTGSVGLISAVMIATLLTKYFGSSPYSCKISKDSIVEVNRDGRRIKFKTLSQIKYQMFTASSEQEAETLAFEFTRDNNADSQSDN